MTDTQQLNDALAANYLLCDLQLRSWNGKSVDKTASKEILHNKGAVEEGGKFMKNLLAGAATELKAVHQLGTALRTFVYTNTLPWSSSSEGDRRGERIIASSRAMNFLVELRDLKREYDAAVTALVRVWDQRVSEAQRNLGMLANPKDYPSASSLPGLFSVSVDLRPLPIIQDFSRLNIPAQLADSLSDRYQEVASIQFDNAMNDLRERIVDELERINKQMAKHAAGEKTRLYDSLVTNMQGLVQLAKSMNMTGNQRLTELAEKIEQRLLHLPVDAYREDPAKAAVAAEDARMLAVEAAMEEVYK